MEIRMFCSKGLSGDRCTAPSGRGSETGGQPSRDRRERWRKWIMAGALIASAAWMTGCGGEHAATKKAEDMPAMAVQIAVADEQTVAEEYVATGTVRARTTTVLSARVMGYLRELKPQAGEMVKAGEVIAVLDAKDIETGVRQAEAARNEARSTVPEAD